MAPHEGESMSTNDGGPAFPRDVTVKFADTSARTEHHAGLSLRDYFAAAALTGLIADRQYGYGGDLKEPRNHHYVAMHAYAFADAMLATRMENTK